MKTGTYRWQLSLALVVLFLAANAGFTMVLHSCGMEDRACCAPRESGTPVQQGSHTPGTDTNLSGASPSCCSETVVGGLNSAMATLEQSLTAGQSKTSLNAGACLHQPPAGVPADDAVNATAHFRFRPPGPPRDGLWLSNSTLLI